jgi:hypothetical protein
MSQLKVQQLFSADIAKRRILLRPAEPSPEELMGPTPEGIFLGKTNLMKIPVFWDPKRLTNPHLAVLGMTGSGKSYLIKTLITRAYRQWRTNAIILDWSGEYTPWVESAGGRVLRLGNNDSINLLDCSPSSAKSSSISITPRTRADQFLNALCILTDLDSYNRQKRLTEQAIHDAYLKKGLNIDKSPPSKSKNKMPTLKDVLHQLGASKKDDEDILACQQRLQRFCSKGFDYFSKPGESIDQLIQSGLVSIDLSALPSENHRSLAGLTILQFIRERMRIQGYKKDKDIKLFVVADEAWKIAQDERSDIISILREGRKYCFSLIVASQNPTDISKTILSNSASLFVFRLMHSSFRDNILESLNLDKKSSIMMEKFPVGCSLTRFAFSSPGLYDGPFIISKILGEPKDKQFIILVEKMEFSFQGPQLKKKLYRSGCTDSQVQILIKEFEKHDYRLKIDSIASRLSAFGFSRAAMLSLFRDLAISDKDIAVLFDRLEAKKYSVDKKEIRSLVLDDEKA